MWPFPTKSDRPPEKQTPHHYVLAHVALKQMAFANPYGFFAVMASPQRQKFLDDLWRQVCENCDQEGVSRISPRDITIHTTKIGEFPTLLIEMPQPYFMTEAYMVCVVLKIPLGDLPQQPADPEIRYFTLDKGLRFETGSDRPPADRTVLCAWDGETHINYGDGPAATPAAFLERVEPMV